MIKNNERGFTLVELIVVVAIVAILASVAMVGYAQFIKSARDSNALNEFNQVYNVIYSDAAAVGIKADDSSWSITTDKGSIVFNMKTTSPDVDYIAKALKDLLNIYLDSGFYQGEFIFEKNKLTYNRPGGGTASRSMDFNYDVKIKIIVGKEDLTYEIITE